MCRLQSLNTTVIGVAALATLWTVPALAQDGASANGTPAASVEPDRVQERLDERYQQMADALKQELPDREIQVQTVAPQPVRLLRADAKLLENKFVAQLVLSPSISDPAVENSQASLRVDLHQLEREFSRSYPKDLVGLLHRIDRFLFNPSLGLSRYPDGRPDLVSTSEHFQRLVKACSPEQLPAKEALDFLTSADADRDVRFATQSVDRGEFTQQSISVFAATADEAKQRAKAIVRLYDGGLSRPMQRYLLGEGEKLLEQAQAAQEQVEALKPGIQAEEANLAKPSDISPEVLNQLKAQKVLVAVELAGLSARVKACDTKLSEPKKLEPSTLQSISEIKVTAEIELVGVKEKLDQINAFIAEGEERQAAQVRRLTLISQRGMLQTKINNLHREAMQYADLFALYAPLRLADNQITVGPIEWTNE